VLPPLLSGKNPTTFTKEDGIRERLPYTVLIHLIFVRDTVSTIYVPSIFNDVFELKKVYKEKPLHARFFSLKLCRVCRYLKSNLTSYGCKLRLGRPYAALTGQVCRGSFWSDKRPVSFAPVAEFRRQQGLLQRGKVMEKGLNRILLMLRLVERHVQD
jgi:hypothetical protein